MSIGLRFTVCRYVPDIVRDEPMNIGVILHSSSEGFTQCQFTRTFVKKFRSDPDLPILLSVIEDLEQRFSFASNLVFSDLELDDLRDPHLLDRLHENYCNQIQFTQPRPFVADDIQQACDYLYRTYVALRHERKSRSTDSAWLRGELAKIFVERGIEDRVKPRVVVMDKYGAPITLDFQWRNGAVNFVQAMSMNDRHEGETLNKAKLWTRNCELIRGITEYTNAGITTVVYPPVRESRNYDTALRILRDQSDVVEFPEVAQVVDEIEAHGHLVS